MNKQNENRPGPGYYDFHKRRENPLAGWKSSFATKDNREGYIPKKDGPGPGLLPPQ